MAAKKREEGEERMNEEGGEKERKGERGVSGWKRTKKIWRIGSS